MASWRLEAAADAVVRVQPGDDGRVRAGAPGGGAAHTEGHRHAGPLQRALRQPRVQVTRHTTTPTGVFARR